MTTNAHNNQAVTPAIAGTQRPSCGTASTKANQAEKGCCGGPAKSDASACCVADEAAKAAGNSGCGCRAEAKST
ncbi:MAG: hypothetical protein AB7O57_02475 [Hyphomicrobiaceae bacterium]